MAQSRKAENARKRRIWKKHLKDWSASGRAQVDYLREHNLSRHQLQYWKKAASNGELGDYSTPGIPRKKTNRVHHAAMSLQ